MSAPRATVNPMDYDAIATSLAASAVAPLRVRRVLADRLGCRGYYDPNTKHITIELELEGLAWLATLAHELGHAASHQRGRPAAYDRAINARPDHWRGLPMDEQRAIVAEETLAWQLGLDLARAHGLVDADEFVAHARAQLENYRDRVDVPGETFDAAIAAAGISSTPRKLLIQVATNEAREQVDVTAAAAIELLVAGMLELRPPPVLMPSEAGHARRYVDMTELGREALRVLNSPEGE